MVLTDIITNLDKFDYLGIGLVVGFLIGIIFFYLIKRIKKKKVDLTKYIHLMLESHKKQNEVYKFLVKLDKSLNN